MKLAIMLTIAFLASCGSEDKSKEGNTDSTQPKALDISQFDAQRFDQDNVCDSLEGFFKTYAHTYMPEVALQFMECNSYSEAEFLGQKAQCDTTDRECFLAKFTVANEKNTDEFLAHVVRFDSGDVTFFLAANPENDVASVLPSKSNYKALERDESDMIHPNILHLEETFRALVQNLKSLQLSPFSG